MCNLDKLAVKYLNNFITKLKWNCLLRVHNLGFNAMDMFLTDAFSSVRHRDYGLRLFSSIPRTAASILLSWDFSNQWGISVGALIILGACICWGIDNNFTRNISSKNPFSIVTIKGLAAGLFSLLLVFVLGSPLPGIDIIVKAMILGGFSYGVSIVLFVLAIRNLGSSRTSAFFATAPFIGMILSIVLLGDMPNAMFVISLPIMILGTILLFKEEHAHKHQHQQFIHEHRHFHGDNHHNHLHKPGEVPPSGCHSHIHEHEELEHEHPHVPDIHHRHVH